LIGTVFCAILNVTQRTPRVDKTGAHAPFVDKKIYESFASKCWTTTKIELQSNRAW